MYVYTTVDFVQRILILALLFCSLIIINSKQRRVQTNISNRNLLCQLQEDSLELKIRVQHFRPDRWEGILQQHPLASGRDRRRTQVQVAHGDILLVNLNIPQVYFLSSELILKAYIQTSSGVRVEDQDGGLEKRIRVQDQVTGLGQKISV